MSQKNQKLPQFGKPIFIITENRLEEELQIAVGDRSYLNALTYFATDAVLVKKLEYDENHAGNLDKVIINRGMVSEQDENKSLEYRMDLSKEPSKGPNGIFIDEDDANVIVEALNKNQKAMCRKAIDIMMAADHKYDEIIAIHRRK